MRLTPKTGRLLVTIVVTLGLYFWDPAWLGRLARAVNPWPGFFSPATVKGVLCVALGVAAALIIYFIWVGLSRRGQTRSKGSDSNRPPTVN
jgi:hypothetical protein